MKQIGFSQPLRSAYTTQFLTEVVRLEVPRRELSGSRVGRRAWLACRGQLRRSQDFGGNYDTPFPDRLRSLQTLGDWRELSFGKLDASSIYAVQFSHDWVMLFQVMLRAQFRVVEIEFSNVPFQCCSNTPQQRSIALYLLWYGG